jgi:hypothetical protein
VRKHKEVTIPTIYTGSVEWPCDPEPFEGDYGPKYSLKVRMDNANAPKARDGIVTIYRAPDHGDTPFMRSLVKDDPVQLLLVEKKPNPYWSFVVPQDWVPSGPPPTAAPQQQRWQDVKTSVPAPSSSAAPKPTNEYQPVTVEDALVFQRVAGDIANNLVGVYNMMRGLLPEDTPEETVRAFSSTVFIQANKVYRQGMVINEPVEHTELEEKYITYVNEAVGDTWTKSAVAKAIVSVLADMYTSSSDNILAVFKNNEISSEDLDPDDRETWLGFLYAVDNWHRETQPAF